MPKLLILSGIPGSKRDKYVKKMKDGWEILSRDSIREILFGRNCYITNKIEEEVTREFNFKLEKAYLCRLNIIYNSTNCKESYIDKIIAECPVNYDVELKFFPMSLIRAFIRNYIRFLKGGTWVPLRVMREMKKNFDLINKNKYKQYIAECENCLK